MHRESVALPIDVEALSRELRSDALSAIRWRLAVLTWMMMVFVPQFGSIAVSANVELPHATSMCCTVARALATYWWIGLPLLGVTYRLIEDRFLRDRPVGDLRFLARAITAAGFFVLLRIWGTSVGLALAF